MDLLNELHILLNVLIASILSGIIGLEREFYAKPAGTKTNMIVGGSVALLVSLGKLITVYFNKANLGNDMVEVDPTRVIQAIIVGISFIGAGTVLQIKSEQKIKYLTTASVILFSTGVSIAVALHHYVLAVGCTLLILSIHLLIRKLNFWLRKNKFSDE